jgi:hypothetical protein
VFCDFLITDWKEQCICLKLWQNALETHKIHKTALGDSTIGRMHTCVWFSCFRYGETSLRLWAQHRVCACMCMSSHTCASETVGWCQNDQIFLLSIKTGDKTCIYCYDTETTQQFSQWENPPLHIWIHKGKLSGWMSRACWLSVLTLMTLFVMNLFLQAKWLTSISAGRFSNIWGDKSADSPWHCMSAYCFVSAAVCGC